MRILYVQKISRYLKIPAPETAGSDFPLKNFGEKNLP